NRQFVVIFHELLHYGVESTDYVTFEVIFDEETSNIIVQYLDVVGSGSNHDYGSGSSVGIENADGSDGLQVSYYQNSILDSMVIMFVAPSTSSETTTELFFSEYGEGSSQTKWLELYNPTEDTLDLSDYTVSIFRNGSSSADYSHSFVGELLPAETFVVTREEANSTVKTYADTVLANGNSTALSFNGNDALALLKAHEVGTGYDTLDIIGVIGVDPGASWSVYSADTSGSTKDHTLTRDSIVTTGNTNWTEAGGTSATAGEWVIHPLDHFDNIGGHPDDPFRCYNNALTFTFYTGSWGE
ncbi:uncharacterized protein METZ01_LOCUS377818, partial [marine metagenome]